MIIAVGFPRSSFTITQAGESLALNRDPFSSIMESFDGQVNSQKDQRAGNNTDGNDNESNQ